jgi:phosphoribosyl 1,2-cyclic phosphodiesterase
VEAGQTRILIDAGLSGRETRRRLELVGIAPDTVSAICVTHEHDDHCGSLRALSRKGQVPLFANSGTIEGITNSGKGEGLVWNVFATGSCFSIGEMQIESFSVPHDSYDPVGFVMKSGAQRLAVVTDMGVVTGLIRERLSGSQVVILESNHDEQMLRDADRPWSLKQRIAGRQGHLSNAQAGNLLASVAGSGLKVVFLAHLSSDCNRPELARRTVCEALNRAGHSHVDVRLAGPDAPSDMVEF